MVSTYDEITDRAYPDYPGGTSLQRWHRRLLRDAMESEGYTVYEAEWWHYDYKDWQKYPIGNVPFDEIAAGATQVRLGVKRKAKKRRSVSVRDAVNAGTRRKVSRLL
jgi:hypothetical protein